MNNCKSFKPSIDNNSKILILGSMPGVKSLEEQQYYAHPQNRFWKVMGVICNEPKLPKFDYDLKLKTLLKKKADYFSKLNKNIKTIGTCQKELEALEKFYEDKKQKKN